MTKPWTAAQLLDAAGQFASGTLADELGRELDSLLRSDPVARRVFTDYMWLHSSLYSDHGSLAAIEPAGATAPPDPSGDMRSASVQQTSKLQLASSHDLGDASATAGRRAGLRWEMIAAALVGVAVASSWLTSQWGSVAPRSDDVAAAAAPSESPESAVAQITGTVNCRWARRSAAVDFGSQLLAGQRLDLDEGLAEITFDNGATVLLEGPASFVVDAGDKLGLVSGRLAVVTPQATGSLRIHTPALDLVQSGGEFGLWARESGAAEVHVFHGQVQADVHDAAGRRLRSLALGASEAIRVHPVSTSVVEFPADDAQFVRSLNSSPGPRDGLLAYEGFRYPEGPLEAQNGGFGWAGPWFTTSADDHAESDSNGVRGGSLAASSLAPIGNRAVQSGHYNRIRRQLATSVGSVFDAAGLVENRDEVRLVGRDGKLVYISFLQRVSRTADGFYGVEFHRGDGNGNRVLCIGNGADGAQYGVTSNVNIYGRQNLPSLGPEDDAVNFFVIRISFGVDNRDVVDVYRNPASLRDESACRPTATLRGNFAFDRISLANFDGTKLHEVDEIRVGTHFLAVTGRWGNDHRRAPQITAIDPPWPRDKAARARWSTLAVLGGSTGRRP